MEFMIKRDKVELLNQVNQEKLMEFTKEISKNVRISGSKEEYEAFQYAEEELQKFGFQTKLYERYGLISFPKEAKLTVARKRYQCITHSMGKSTPQSGITTELIDMGGGTQENYESVNVTGKAILLDGLATPGAVQTAEAAGAAAAIFINAEYTHEMIVSTVWGNPTLEKVEQYPSIPVLSVNYQDGQEIRRELQENGSAPCHLKTKVITEWRKIPTLIAEYKGEVEPEKYVLFSGHIDSWHYGAMDNGSANATMLEVARIIGENKLKLYRSLKLAFWSGHSHGRYAGSALFADENWENLYDHCVLHLNIDSVGGKGAVVLSEGNAMQETKHIAASAIKEIAQQEFTSTRYGRAGDQSFWGPGVPSLLMGLSEQLPDDSPSMEAFNKLFGGSKGGGFGWWWHTTEDTIDKISPQFLQRDCKIYLSIVLDVCTEPVLPINQMAAVEELEGYILQYVEKMRHLEVLQRTITRIRLLKERIEKVEDRFKQLKNPDRDQIALYNDWNMQMSRGLVRLNYVKSNEFDHDPAAGQPPLPLLADAAKYSELLSLEEKCVIETTVRRNANQVNFKLRDLIDISDKYLKSL